MSSSSLREEFTPVRPGARGERRSSRKDLRHSLDAVGEDGEAHEDADRPIQVPHLGLVLEHLHTDENGEAHDSAHQRVEACKDKNAGLVFLTQVRRPWPPSGTQRA